jgi:hypothetical protein
LHSDENVQVPSVALPTLSGALGLKGESLLSQFPNMAFPDGALWKKLPSQSELKAATTPPPNRYECRLLPSVVPSK